MMHFTLMRAELIINSATCNDIPDLFRKLLTVIYKCHTLVMNAKKHDIDYKSI